MKIRTIRIQNFRTLSDLLIQFDAVTTFIGPNGTGKSTVLRALDWFFNGKPGAISEGDCSFGKVENPIEVRVTFCDLTATDREALGKYAPDDVDTFTAWKTRMPDGTEAISANAKSYQPFNAIRIATAAGDKKVAYNILRSADQTLALPGWTNAEAVLQTLTTWEAGHLDLLTESPEALQTNFFGFNSSGKMSGLFDFVLVTADLRASEESTDAKTSIIGRILERSVDRSIADEAIKLIVEESRLKQQQVYEEKFTDQLISMTSMLNEVVGTYSPGRSISVTPSEVELKAPRTTFGVSVMDGTTETTVERQGHGFQRTLLVSSLQLLAQSGSAAAEGVICLAIEEPELFQHPVQAQAFAKVLRSLADDPEKRIQVTYATHSPYFLEPRYFHQVRRLTRSVGPLPIVSIHAANVEEVKLRLAGIVPPEVVDRQLDGIVTDRLAVALFASRVLLVEGTSDSAVFHGIGDKLGHGSLEASGISIVPVGGKTSLNLPHAILTLLGIPVFLLFDADRDCETRAKAKGKPDAKILEERNKNIAENRNLLKYLGQVEVDFPDAVVTDTFAVFEDRLEEFLNHNWPEWIVACNALETSTGVSLAKNHGAYRSATLSANGDVPQMLSEIISKAKGEIHE